MNTLHKRLKDNGRVLIDPLPTQIGGLLLSVCIFLIGTILFEHTIGELSGGIWRWIWRIIFDSTVIILAYKFFKTGLAEPIPMGHAGIPRFFGKPSEKIVYPTGRYWELPGKGNKMVVVDMRSQGIELKINVTTKDNLKMICPLNLNYHVYNPNVYAELKDFKKTFDSMLSQAFLDLSSDTDAKDMLQVRKTDVLEKIVTHIKDIPGPDPNVEDFKIDDFGIEIQEKTISVADGFDFADQTTRNAYEAVGQEKEERKSQRIEIAHFLKLANRLVTQSGGTIPFNEAYLRIHQQYGKNAPDEKVYRLAGLPENLFEFLTQVNFFPQTNP